MNYIGLIGEGSFGKVHLVYNSISNHLEAVKVFKNNELAQQEIVNHNQVLPHKNIIDFYNVEVNVSGDLCMFLEFVAPGDMLNYLNSKNKEVTEEEARYYFIQLLDAVEHCHSCNIVHRDIKLENLLLHGTTLKLADFGYSEEIDKINLTKIVGTPQYLAPEILVRKINDPTKIDIWSCGVVLYTILTSHYPFIGSDVVQTLKKIIKAEFAPLPDRISDKCRDLISKILTSDPSKRYSIQQIRTHPWMKL